jgi:hypothetical protein
MRSRLLVGALTLILAGCQSKTGNGAWSLKIGGEAKLVSADGSDVTLESFASPDQGKSKGRAPRESKIEQVTLPAGTTVVIHAIDGDDARVEIKDGARAGSIYWVECARLESLAR